MAAKCCRVLILILARPVLILIIAALSKLQGAASRYPPGSPPDRPHGLLLVSIAACTATNPIDTSPASMLGRWARSQTEAFQYACR